MTRQSYAVGEAARLLGISIDTLRRWDRQGRLRVERDAANRRLVPAEEIERLRGASRAPALSARNRLPGRVTRVEVEGMLARVEIALEDPGRVVAIITRDAVEDLGLRAGVSATAVVKSTSVMVER